MDIFKLIIILTLIVGVMKFRQPLYAAMAAGIIGASVLYTIWPLQAIKIMGKSMISYDTISLILAFYTITFLQRMLEIRDHLTLAERSLSGLFNSRRVNAMVAPFIIGLLPSAGAVLIAAPIVDNAGGNYISKEDKTFIASFYRHIPECFLPVYSSILLALSLSKVDMTSFVLGMLPLVVLLFVLGYLFYVRKLPKETGFPESEDKSQDIRNLIISLWPVAISIAIILILKIPVYIATPPVILLSIFINKFTLQEIMPIFLKAFEIKLILTTVVIMMFKDMLTFTGVIERLPEQFATFPVPIVVIFGLIFFFGTLIAGATAMIALSLPLAFAALPTGGVALLIFLMSLSYISMQISPTHICLAIVTERFDTSMYDLVKSTIPILVIFTIASSLYSYLLFLY
ncbi:MAG TPA: DUF401 family protein [Desulfosporosinus sp.]|nr:DUF401 family protein [Desulfosporosinus sp.]